MSTAATHAAAFYREVAPSRALWTVKDAGGYGAASAALRMGFHGAIERLSARGLLGISGSGVALIGGAE